MKRRLVFVVSAVALLPVFAAEREEQYSPPVLANGELCGLFDFRNMMAQDVPSYRTIRCTGGVYRPSIYREGRRTDNLKLACLGRIEERVGLGGAEDVRPVDWNQRMDVRQALSICTNVYANGARIDSEAFIASGCPVLAVKKVFTGEIASYTFEYLFRRVDSYERNPLQTTWTASGDTLSFTVEKAAGDLHGKVRLLCEGGVVRVTDRGLAATLVKPRGEVKFALVFTDDFNEESRTAPAFASWYALRAEHVARWTEWTERTFVKIPDARLQSVYDCALYTLKCWSTPWSIPVGILPSHWNGAFFGFTFFGPALGATGHEDDLRKIARYWNSLVPAARQRASRAHPDDTTADIRYCWLSDEFGNETSGNGRWREHIQHMGTICKEIENCCLYREDMTFLKEVYPVLRGSAEFYANQAVYETKDGKTIIGTCCDMERLATLVRNPFQTTCAAIKALQFAAFAAARLGIDGDKAERWMDLARRLRRDLPHDGAKYIPYAGAKDRNVSVLSGAIPYRILCADDPKQVAAIADFDRNSFEAGNMVKAGSRVCSWFAAWTAAAQALIGDGEGACRNLRLSAASAGRFAEIFEINEPGLMSIPWTSSPQGTFVEAINTMLLRCEGDTIFIAPAVPKAWKDFSFRLKAYDDVTVDVAFEKGRCVLKELSYGPAWSGRPKKVVKE